jgi:hypothetical protein
LKDDLIVYKSDCMNKRERSKSPISWHNVKLTGAHEPGIDLTHIRPRHGSYHTLSVPFPLLLRSGSSTGPQMHEERWGKTMLCRTPPEASPGASRSIDSRRGVKHSLWVYTTPSSPRQATQTQIWFRRGVLGLITTSKASFYEQEQYATLDLYILRLPSISELGQR